MIYSPHPENRSASFYNKYATRRVYLKKRVIGVTLQPLVNFEMKKPKRPFIPLSWEHHHGLSLIWRIRRGIERQTADEVLMSYVIPFWDQNIALHFDLEEKVFLPVLSPDEPFVHRLREDHRILRGLMDALRSESTDRPVPEDRAIKDRLRELAATLEAHIRFEEREVFPKIAHNLSDEKREGIEKVLQENFHRLVEPETPAFWE